MIILDMDIPKSCSKCELAKISSCPLFYRNAAESIAGRLSDCPIKCDIEDIKVDIQGSKLWKGFSDNPNLRKHDIGLDRHFDLGLDKALNVIDTHTKGSEERNSK